MNTEQGQKRSEGLDFGLIKTQSTLSAPAGFQ